MVPVHNYTLHTLLQLEISIFSKVLVETLDILQLAHMHESLEETLGQYIDPIVPLGIVVFK